MPGKFKNLPAVVFIGSLTIVGLGLSFAYGVISYRENWFPIPQAKEARWQIIEMFKGSDRRLHTDNLKYQDTIAAPHADKVQPGLLLISGIRERRNTYIRVMDRAGRVIHEWVPIWSEIWPDNEGSFPKGRRPASMYVHGVELLPDGSVVGNFEHLSSFRLDICGNVMWKLDNLGHHVAHYSDTGDLWVGAERYIAPGGDTGFRGQNAPLQSFSMQRVGDNGEILQEIEVIDLFQRNDLDGLLFLYKDEKGDTLHLNDIDIFPHSLESEVFEPGDMMISLRNINTIVVFDPETLKVKFVSTGKVLAQHDPDFMANDIISVFDNHNRIKASRIVEINARTGEASVALSGKFDDGFFTRIMGTHDRLANGNIMVAATLSGHALEYLPNGELAWRFSNRISETRNGNVFLAQVLPPEIDEAYFQRLTQQCK